MTIADWPVCAGGHRSEGLQTGDICLFSGVLGERLCQVPKFLKIPRVSMAAPPQILCFLSGNELNITNTFVRPKEKVIPLQDNFEHF